jgi:hypothetical protein
MGALQAPMEKTEELHWEAWKAPSPTSTGSGRPRSGTLPTMRMPTSKPSSPFERLKPNRKAEIAEKRKELEQRIATWRKRIWPGSTANQRSRGALKEINKNKDREKWNAQRVRVRELPGHERSLEAAPSGSKTAISEPIIPPDGNNGPRRQADRATPEPRPPRSPGSESDQPGHGSANRDDPGTSSGSSDLWR